MAKKEMSTDWKHQVARAERKSRLARMKGTDGHKKKIERHSVWEKVTFSILAVVLILALLVWLIASTGLVTKSVTALTVGDRKLTAADLNIVMGNMTASEQYGLAFSDEFQKELDRQSPLTPGVTVREEIVNQLMPSITFMYAALNEIEKEGFVPSEDQLAEMDKNAKSLEEQFTQMSVTSGQSVSKLARLYYGPGASLRLIERDLRSSMLISYYQEHLKEQTDLSDDKVEDYYQEHKDLLDVYTYYTYVFKPNLKEGATAEEKKAALDDLAKLADKARGDLEKTDFARAILNHLEADEAEAIEADPDALLARKVRADRAGAAVLNFLKEEGRKEGDAKVIEGADSVTLVQFVSRERDDFKPYSVRHILIRNPEEAPAEKTDEELREEAGRILKEFTEGERTEEAFVKLVVKYSMDPGSKASGGLYKDVASGAMVREFENWCTETGRKKGDTGLVKSGYGYHIMYFEGYGDEPELPGRIREALKTAHLNDWMSAVTRDVEVRRHPFGMKFVGRSDFFQALFGRPPAEPEATIPQLTPGA